MNMKIHLFKLPKLCLQAILLLLEVSAYSQSLALAQSKPTVGSRAKTANAYSSGIGRF